MEKKIGKEKGFINRFYDWVRNRFRSEDELSSNREENPRPSRPPLNFPLPSPIEPPMGVQLSALVGRITSNIREMLRARPFPTWTSRDPNAPADYQVIKLDDNLGLFTTDSGDEDGFLPRRSINPSPRMSPSSSPLIRTRSSSPSVPHSSSSSSNLPYSVVNTFPVPSSSDDSDSSTGTVVPVTTRRVLNLPTPDSRALYDGSHYEPVLSLSSSSSSSSASSSLSARRRPTTPHPPNSSHNLAPPSPRSPRRSRSTSTMSRSNNHPVNRHTPSSSSYSSSSSSNPHSSGGSCSGTVAPLSSSSSTRSRSNHPVNRPTVILNGQYNSVTVSTPHSSSSYTSRSSSNPPTRSSGASTSASVAPNSSSSSYSTSSFSSTTFTRSTGGPNPPPLSCQSSSSHSFVGFVHVIPSPPVPPHRSRSCSPKTRRFLPDLTQIHHEINEPKRIPRILPLTPPENPNYVPPPKVEYTVAGLPAFFFPLPIRPRRLPPSPPIHRNRHLPILPYPLSLPHPIPEIIESLVGPNPSFDDE